MLAWIKVSKIKTLANKNLSMPFYDACKRSAHILYSFNTAGSFSGCQYAKEFRLQCRQRSALLLLGTQISVLRMDMLPGEECEPLLCTQVAH